jgi:hypothetical protein
LAFIATTVQSPLRTGHTTVWVPGPVACASQRLARQGPLPPEAVPRVQRLLEAALADLKRSVSPAVANEHVISLTGPSARAGLTSCG